MAKAKYSQAELLKRAARLVGQTINPEAMGVNHEDVDLEQFIELFAKKAKEMLEEKERILLGVGPYLTKSGTPFTEDLTPIMEFIEKETQLKFHFFNGILIYLGREDIAASWIPDRPI